MGQDKREREDAKFPPALAKLFNLMNNPNNQNPTLQSKNPVPQPAVGLFNKMVTSWNQKNKDNPDAQVTLQKKQTQQGIILSMILSNNTAMMNMFLQQLSKMLPQLLNQSPSPFAPRSPTATKPRPS